jgi:DNA-binding response OmpR family regulator
MKRFHILIVDDDKRMLTYLEACLRSAGYCVLKASDGYQALECIRSNLPDMVILDLMMPGMDGIEVMREARTFSSVPIILLTAKVCDDDKVRGLRLGADDYITKPFKIDELIARIDALKRRIQPPSRRRTLGVFVKDKATIDFEKRTIYIDGIQKRLTEKEWQLLIELMHNSGQYVPYRQLLASAWGKDYVNDMGLLRTWISRLRNKLDDSSCNLIKTVTKVGYIINK